MKWWRARNKKGWLYFAYPEDQAPHDVVRRVLGRFQALEEIAEPPRLQRLGPAVVDGQVVTVQGHPFELYCE